MLPLFTMDLVLKESGGEKLVKYKYQIGDKLDRQFKGDVMSSIGTEHD